MILEVKFDYIRLGSISIPLVGVDLGKLVVVKLVCVWVALVKVWLSY